MKKYLILILANLGMICCGIYRNHPEYTISQILKDTSYYKFIDIKTIKEDSIYTFLIKNNTKNSDTIILTLRKNFILYSKITDHSNNDIYLQEYLFKNHNKSREVLIHKDTISQDYYFYNDKRKSLKKLLKYNRGQLRYVYEYYQLTDYGAPLILKSEKYFENGEIKESKYYRPNGVIQSKNLYQKGEEIKVILYDKKGHYKASITPPGSP